MAIHVVTGGSGFVGNCLVTTLAARGHDVRIIDPLSPTHLTHSVQHFKGSILDLELLRHAFKGADTVHHMAAAVPLVGSKNVIQETNVEGTRLVWNQASQAKIKHFNFMSSSAVYGKVEASDCPIKENLNCLPFEDYGKSKLQAEQFICQHENSNKMSYTILRPRTILGAGRLGIFDLLFNWVRFGRPIYLVGDGSNIMQLIHVKDLAEVAILCAEHRTQDILNVGTDHYGTLRQALQNLCSHVGSSSNIVSTPIMMTQTLLMALDKARLSPFSSWHYRMIHSDFYFDTSTLKNLFNWKAQYSNDQMLIESYEWYLQNQQPTSERNSVHRRSLKKGILHFFMK